MPYVEPDTIVDLPDDPASMMSHQDSKGDARRDADMALRLRDPDFAAYDAALVRVQEQQPVLNLCTLGDVSHGKSTLMHALSGEKTGRFGDEQRRNMTIHLGYTSCKIWKCLACGGRTWPSPMHCYFSTSSSATASGAVDAEHEEKAEQRESTAQQPQVKKRKTKKKRRKKKQKDLAQCPQCQSSSADDLVLVRHVSFVDCPGHSHLMGTMISCANVVDGALLVVDASKRCPGEMTEQHAHAAAMLGVLHQSVDDDEEDRDHDDEREHKTPSDDTRRGRVIVAQNKIDLVDPSRACQQHEDIQRFLEQFGLRHEAPIVPVCAQQGLNMDALCYHIVRQIPMPVRRVDAPLNLQVIRSFDVNKPHEIKDVMTIKGGVIGGVILQGSLAVGDEVEIRPGLVSRLDGRVFPLRSRVVALQCGRQKLAQAFPGANVGVELTVDSSLTKANRMVGHVLVPAAGQGGKLTCTTTGDPEKPPVGPGLGPLSLIRPPPPVFTDCIISFTPVPLPGKHKWKEFTRGEDVRLNIGANKLTGKLLKMVTFEVLTDPEHRKEKGLHVRFNSPVCGRVGDRMAVTRQVSTGVWRLALGAVVRRVRVLPCQEFGT